MGPKLIRVLGLANLVREIASVGERPDQVSAPHLTLSMLLVELSEEIYPLYQGGEHKAGEVAQGWIPWVTSSPTHSDYA